jgi:regulator of sigma E protease
MVLLIVGLILFVSLVIVHEFGHFIAARKGGVEVEEFGIGFPPKIYGKKFKNHKTEYTINLLPLGGFVKLKGAHDSDTGKGSYGAARFRTKVAIMLAGVGMNILTAWLIFSFLAVVGLPQLPLPNDQKQFSVASDTKVLSNDVYVGYVEENSPAAKAGLVSGDKLTAFQTLKKCDQLSTTNDDYDKFCNPNITSAEYIRPRIQELLKEGNVDVVLGINDRTISITPRSIAEIEASEKNGDKKGYIGIDPVDFTLTRSTWSAPIVGAGLTYQFTSITFTGIFDPLKDLFTGNATEAGKKVSGPIGIFFLLEQGTELGYKYILLIIALLSITLAVLNVLPIPTLDGGRLFVTALFRVMKKKLTIKTEERIYGTGFVFLMTLLVVISVVDARRFF